MPCILISSLKIGNNKEIASPNCGWRCRERCGRPADSALGEVREGEISIVVSNDTEDAT
jgi:hypothetical protein